MAEAGADRPREAHEGRAGAEARDAAGNQGAMKVGLQRVLMRRAEAGPGPRM
jgi:hypothetical protein